MRNNLTFALLALATALAGLPDNAHSQSVSTILEDDFDGPFLDSGLWSVGDWWIGDRTYVHGVPEFGTEGNTTFVTLRLETYDSQFPGEALSGTEILSKTEFDRGEGLEFEARVRVRTETAGIVDSFFTYGPRGDWPDTTSDEIDFEWLTRQPGDRILTTTWNDWHTTSTTYDDGIHHSSLMAVLDGVDRGNWNVLKIRWLPDRTEWYVNGELVRSTTEALADDPMSIRVNTWAAGSGWTDAYSAGLQPTASPANNLVYRYDIDYIRVSAIGQSSPPSGIPAAPTNLTATSQGSSINLGWQDNSTNETLFEVHRAEKTKGKGGGTTAFVLIGSVGANTVIFSDSPGKGNWIYKVRASNSSAASEFSNEVQVHGR